jgi:protein involved in sex pheromone biosynthesis
LAQVKGKSTKATKKNKKETDKETASKTVNAGTTKLKDGFKNLGKGIGDWFKAYKGVLGKVGLVAAGIAIAAVSIGTAMKHYNKDKLAAE